MGRVRFHELEFSEDFLTAVRDDGAELRFTRQERIVLEALATRARRLFSRGELMGLLDSEGSDRLVDFVINKLRAKLGDPARAPRFIATQYGEGYLWTAPAITADPPPRDFLAIGPVSGGGSRGEAAAQRLLEALQAQCAPGRSIRLAPDWRRGLEGALAPRYSLEVRFHIAGPALAAAVALRQEPSGRVIRSAHWSVDEAESLGTAALATEILDAVWESIALGDAPAPGDPPLLVRMYEAAEVLGAGDGSHWSANRPPLSRARARNPRDARLAVMTALQLVGGIIMDSGPEPLGSARLKPIEDEIEAQVRGSLADIRRDPTLSLGAAKALLFICRDIDLVESLAHTAFASSAAFAASFPMFAGIHAYRGDLARALDFYDEGWRLCDKGSEFELYILCLKAQTLMAADDREAANAVFLHMNRIKPATRAQLGRLFVPPWGSRMDADLFRLVDTADLALARRAVTYQYFVAARHFGAPAHRANVMEGPLSHFVRRFGPEVAPDEIWDALGGALDHLRRPAVA